MVSPVCRSRYCPPSSERQVRAVSRASQSIGSRRREAYKRDVDRTLLRENLRKTPDERLRDLVRLQAFAEDLRRAGERARRR